MFDSIIILGMHRSGTSCLTGCLKSYGLELGDVSNYNKYNKKGNQENKAVFRLNEALLKHNGGSWFKPPVGEMQLTPELIDRREKLLDYYQSLPKPWGVKDPRMLLTYNFWKDSLPKHALIGTFRHPKAVAKSLEARDRLSIPMKQGYSLWHVYNKNLIELQKKYDFPVINFDLPPTKYIEQFEIIAKGLNLSKTTESNFFDSTLLSYQPFEEHECPKELLPTYQQLLSIRKF